MKLKIRTHATRMENGDEDITTTISGEGLEFRRSITIDKAYLELLSENKRIAAIKLHKLHNEFDAKTELMEIGLEIASMRLVSIDRPKPIRELV